MTKDKIIAHCEGELARLRADNLIFQDALNMRWGELTCDERKEFLRMKISYRSLAHQYEQVCSMVEQLTGRDPRLPIRHGD